MSTQVTVHAKRKPGVHVWKEPKRRGGPEWTSKQVAAYLKISTERVMKLARIGPEGDGLAAYVNVGKGWERRNGQKSKLGFYPEDVIKWGQEHPIQVMESSEYSELEKQTLLHEAKLLKEETGMISRVTLMERLRYDPKTLNSDTKAKRPRNEPGYGIARWEGGNNPCNHEKAIKTGLRTCSKCEARRVEVWGSRKIRTAKVDAILAATGLTVQEYTELEKEVVLREAEAIRDPVTGAVPRSQLMERLRYDPETGAPRTEPGYGTKVWYDRRRPIFIAILDDAGIPAQTGGRPKRAKTSATK